MNDEPSKIRIDFAAYGIPAGRYSLPGLADARRIADGTAADEIRIADRFTRHFTGDLTVADLTPAEFQLIRDDFHEQVADRREQTQQQYRNQVPHRFAAATPDNAANAWAKQVVTDLHSARSLVLCGPVGTGKTHYAWSALRALADTGARITWRATTEADMFAQLRPGGAADAEGEIEKLASVGVLLIDDLGAAKNSEWTEEVTYRIVNRRYEECRPSIFTTNVHPDHFTTTLGARIASRLAQMCDVVEVKGADRRKGDGQ
ncbi:ATP-binding protein [Streptomyces niveus]|uniref:ATP-binding protein n=1 Tax=Streptomyces niveus TaxID=193462 RepID=UPI00386F4AC1